MNQAALVHLWSACPFGEEGNEIALSLMLNGGVLEGGETVQLYQGSFECIETVVEQCAKEASFFDLEHCITEHVSVVKEAIWQTINLDGESLTTLLCLVVY